MDGEKVLWVVNYDDPNWFVERAKYVGAKAVAIRTDNDLIKAIPAFQGEGIKVYGWRWPSTNRASAMKEAGNVVDLLAKGLDGYFVDPEQASGKLIQYNWDQGGLEKLAEDFCSAITSAGVGKPFGTTSHFRCNTVFTKLPWKSFFQYASIFLPQAYWRSSDGKIGKGPGENYLESIDCWSAAGAPTSQIAPMAGELAQVSAAEIDEYVNAAKQKGIKSLHFYTADKKIAPPVWDAVQRATI